MASGAEHKVYKKDAEGSFYVVGETVVDNQILQHDPNFRNVADTIQKLPYFKTRPDDIWIVDYMKSGTHWAYEILNLLTRDAVTRPLQDKLINFMEMVGEIEQFDEKESPRIINTHLQLKHMSKHILDKSKIVFPLRNPKSVILSNYHHCINLKNYEYNGSFAGFMPFIMEPRDDLYGTWFDMVIPYWEYLKGKPNVHFVVYEELIQNPVKGIKDISDFIGLDHDKAFCRHVAEESKFDAMRSREQEVVGDSPYIKQQEGFIRKGSTTEWKSHFTVAQNEMFDAVYEEKMKDYPDLKEMIKF